MSGGGSQGTSQQSNTTSNEPPAYIQPALKAGVDDLSIYYAQNKKAPDYYPNSTVAPQSAETQQALTALAQRGANGSPEVNAASRGLTDTLGGKYLDPTTNPDYLHALSASHQPYVDQFMGEILPGITSAFEGAGRTGSGLHQDSVDRAVTGLNRTIGDSDAKAGSDYFSQERARQMQGIGMAPAIQGAGYQDIAALGQAGEGRDAYSQSKINEDIARYNYKNTGQMDYINHYLASLNAGYPGGQTNSTSFGTQTQPGGGFGSIFGPAMSAAGLGLGAYGMFGGGAAAAASPAMAMAPALMFSDERLKENIVPVGETYDGQTLHLYNYKGDSTPQVGLIAQEVERVHPDAVVEHPSGYKMVDYGKAMGLF